MAVDKIINGGSETIELRKFGITFSIAMGLVGSLFLWRGSNRYLCFFIISGLSLLSGLIAPMVLKPVRKVLMLIINFLSRVVTGIILAAIFYFVVTPLGLIARLFGKDYLDLKIDEEAASYWIHKNQVPFKKSYYEKPFSE